MAARKTAQKKVAPKAAAKSARTTKPKAKKAASLDPIARVREICLALPETTEVVAWGSPTFRVTGKIFVMYAAPGSHHTAGRPAIWILSVNMEQDLVLRARPDRYFKPPYVGSGGWIGAYVDKNPPWGELEELIRDGWRRRAPKKIVALIGD